MNIKPLLLASESRYRKELLSRLGLPFETRAPLCDEEALKQQFHALAPADLAQALACAKAESLKADFADTWIIGSDQLLQCNGKIYGKAGSRDQAVMQLQELAGLEHELLTAFALAHSAHPTFVALNRTRIRLKKLSVREIEAYVDFDQAWDCAGSYKMERKGLALVESMECNDPSAIIGLPLIELGKALEARGLNLFVG